MKRTLLGLGALALIALACNTQTELRPDPAVDARNAAEEVRRAEHRARLESMTVEKAAWMERELLANPADRETRNLLIEFYLAANRMPEYRELKRPHALWFIEFAPESNSASRWGTGFNPRDGKNGDLDGYEAARTLWMAHLAQPKVPAPVLRTAAKFFREWEAPKSEELLLRGQAEKLADPNDPDYRWSEDLADLYFNVLYADGRPVPSTNRTPPYDEHAYAQSISRKLSETQDVDLLTAVANRFVSLITVRSSGEQAVEIRRVGHSALERALVLDPQSAAVKEVQARVQSLERDARLATFLNPGRIHSATAEQFAALSEDDKFYVQPRIARFLEKRGDESSWDQARIAADNALALAPKFRNDPDYSSTVFMEHMTIGLMYIRANQREPAAEHLRAAAEVPSAPNITISELETSMLLVALLKNNERATVIEFLESLAKLSTSASDRKWLLDSAAQIRKGLMPEWYQRMIKGR